jgi:hypothetical protein
LNDRKITDKEFFGAVEWVIYETETKEYNSQWWRPETLANKKNIAGDWSFGQTFLLDRYSRNLKNDKEVNSDILSFENRNSEISQIENALLKTLKSKCNVNWRNQDKKECRLSGNYVKKIKHQKLLLQRYKTKKTCTTYRKISYFRM